MTGISDMNDGTGIPQILFALGIQGKIAQTEITQTATVTGILEENARIGTTGTAAEIAKTGTGMTEIGMTEIRITVTVTTEIEVTETGMTGTGMIEIGMIEIGMTETGMTGTGRTGTVMTVTGMAE